MNHCRECKHWGRRLADCFQPGVAESPWRLCLRFPPESDNNSPEGADWLRVHAQDRHVYTGPKFGCCHWEGRDG